MLAGDRRFAATLSLAGITRHPAPSPLPTRTGGFGGPDGLARHLLAHRIDRLVDATHPFAARMAANAAAAAAATATARLRLCRPPWLPGPDDRWLPAADMGHAAFLLGPVPRRVLLTVGRADLAPFLDAPHHHYVARSIEPPEPHLLAPGAEQILSRPPYDLAGELGLLQRHRIDLVVTKNSGGEATVAKLHAARILGRPVILVARPPEPPGPTVATATEALDWLVAAACARPAHAADLGE